MVKIKLTLFFMLVILLIIPLEAKSYLFQDNFDTGSSPLWSNSIGNWTTSGGVYYAQQPSTNPLTYTSLPYILTDFKVSFNVNNIRDGGIFLRSSFNPLNNHISGVYLVLGGHGGTGNGMYWQFIHDQNPSTSSIYNEARNLFTPGITDANIKIVVSGNLYSAYVNNNPIPATTFYNNEFSSGMVALYDYGVFSQSERQSFDNFKLDGSPVPLPSAILLLGAGLGRLVLYRRRKMNAKN
jgi:hypothetical protein